MKKTQFSKGSFRNGASEIKSVGKKLGGAMLCAAALVLVCACPANLTADEIRLKDGTVVYGKIGAVEGGIVSITPGFNADGSVKVFKFKMDDVLTFTSNDPIYLATGAESNQSADNTYFGTVESAATGINIKTSTGAVTVPLSQVKMVYRTQDESPQTKAIKKLERKWTAELTLDARGKDASARQTGTSVGFSAVNSGANDTLTLYGKYNYYKSRDAGQKRWQKSADDLNAGVDYRCNFTDHFLWYARTNDGFNKVTFIDFFAESAVGLGFQAIKEDKHKLEFRLGSSYRYESYHTGHWVTIEGEQKTSQSLAGLDVGLNYTYEWSWGRFTDAITYMPAFDDVGNFILRHEAALEFPVANSEYWRVRVGISNDYNSHPASHVRKLETTYFASIVLRWK